MKDGIWNRYFLFQKVNSCIYCGGSEEGAEDEEEEGAGEEDDGEEEWYAIWIYNIIYKVYMSVYIKCNYLS